MNAPFEHAAGADLLAEIEHRRCKPHVADLVRRVASGHGVEDAIGERLAEVVSSTSLDVEFAHTKCAWVAAEARRLGIDKATAHAIGANVAEALPELLYQHRMGRAPRQSDVAVVEVYRERVWSDGRVERSLVLRAETPAVEAGETAAALLAELEGDELPNEDLPF